MRFISLLTLWRLIKLFVIDAADSDLQIHCLPFLVSLFQLEFFERCLARFVSACLGQLLQKNIIFPCI